MRGGHDEDMYESDLIGITWFSQVLLVPYLQQ
jgi:hypothetical protein